MRVELQDGGSVLLALRSAGVHVPALCHDDRMAPSGACRTCLVNVKGLTRLVTACTTPLVDGMEIETDTAELQQTRRGVLEMLVRHYPARAIGLFPDKPFHEEIRRADLVNLASDCAQDIDQRDCAHPYIARPIAACALLFRASKRRPRSPSTDHALVRQTAQSSV
jgi:formate dehydrogenase major subunit